MQKEESRLLRNAVEDNAIWRESRDDAQTRPDAALWTTMVAASWGRCRRRVGIRRRRHGCWLRRADAVIARKPQVRVHRQDGEFGLLADGAFGRPRRRDAARRAG